MDNMGGGHAARQLLGYFLFLVVVQNLVTLVWEIACESVFRAFRPGESSQGVVGRVLPQPAALKTCQR